MTIQFEGFFFFFFFFLIRIQNGECNVRNFRRFLFGMSPDVPAFRVCVFTSDFKFELELMDISSRHSNSNFAHSFDFHCLINFAKNLNLS